MLLFISTLGEDAEQFPDRGLEVFRNTTVRNLLCNCCTGHGLICPDPSCKVIAKVQFVQLLQYRNRDIFRLSPPLHHVPRHKTPEFIEFSLILTLDSLQL
jgi:hypothetical protein